jgi:hypothetical protein
VVGRDDFDAAAGDRAANLFRRHVGRNDRAWPVTVGILPAHIGDDADPEHRIIGKRPAGSEERQQNGSNRLDRTQRQFVSFPGLSGDLSMNPDKIQVPPRLGRHSAMPPSMRAATGFASNEAQPAGLPARTGLS